MNRYMARGPKSISYDLFKFANQARRELAIAPASHRLIGAAAETTLLRAVKGGNKEISGHHAIDVMVDQLALGEKLLRLLIVGGTFPRQDTASVPLSPCGHCRDVLQRYSSDETQILLMDEESNERWLPVSELLPQTFHRTHPLAELDTGSEEYKMFHSALTMLTRKPSEFSANNLHAAAALTTVGLPTSAVQIDDITPVEGALEMAANAFNKPVSSVLYLYVTDNPSIPKFPDGKSLQKIWRAGKLAGIDDMPVIAVSVRDISSIEAALKNGMVYFSRVSKLLPFAFNLDIDPSQYV